MAETAVNGCHIAANIVARMRTLQLRVGISVGSHCFYVNGIYMLLVLFVFDRIKTH